MVLSKANMRCSPLRGLTYILDQGCPLELSAVMEILISVLFNMVAIGYLWPSNVSRANEKLEFKFCLVLIIVNLTSNM